MTTINIKPDELIELVDAKIKSIQRAINTTTIPEIKPHLQQAITRLTNAKNTIDQHELPLKKS